MLGFRVAAGYFCEFFEVPKDKDDKKGGVPSMSYNRDIAIVCRKLDDLGLGFDCGHSTEETSRGNRRPLLMEYPRTSPAPG